MVAAGFSLRLHRRDACATKAFLSIKKTLGVSVGADPGVRSFVRAHTQVRPYNTEAIITSMGATWYKSPIIKGGLYLAVKLVPPFSKGGRGIL
jgi:hypothetical protein